MNRYPAPLSDYSRNALARAGLSVDQRRWPPSISYPIVEHQCHCGRSQLGSLSGSELSDLSYFDFDDSSDASSEPEKLNFRTSPLKKTKEKTKRIVSRASRQVIDKVPERVLDKVPIPDRIRSSSRDRVVESDIDVAKLFSQDYSINQGHRRMGSYSKW